MIDFPGRLEWVAELHTMDDMVAKGFLLSLSLSGVYCAFSCCRRRD